ncbi:MAG: 50S ribosomal protein L18 [Candidatus Eisenbacteria sp.]|nr:50S ribosomal protein L18 [Candidatus Eisenbacteria bacterium]
MLRDYPKKVKNRLRRKRRVRKKIVGTSERPRLSVFRSCKNLYAQIIDDTQGRTLVAACSLSREIREQSGKDDEKYATPRATGLLLAKRAQEKGVTQVCFDRGAHLYHGRVRAFAEACRKGGLVF